MEVAFMLTMNQVGALINSVTLIIIFGFVFCVIHMITSHIFKIKAIKNGSVESEKFLALRKQLVMGLGILIACFFLALMLMSFLQNWNSASAFDILISDHPLARRSIINEVINTVRLLVIFTFVGAGIRFVLRYREQAAELKKSDNGAEHHHIMGEK
jgi:hypothetical protein